MRPGGYVTCQRWHQVQETVQNRQERTLFAQTLRPLTSSTNNSMILTAASNYELCESRNDNRDSGSQHHPLNIMLVLVKLLCRGDRDLDSRGGLHQKGPPKMAAGMRK